MSTRRNTVDVPAASPPVARYTCRLCGVQFPVPHHGGRGRPPEFCGKECREASAALTVLERWLGPVAKRADVKHWQDIRYRLWSLANASPAFQKAMAQRSKERQAAIRAVPEARERQKRAPRPTFIVTIGTTPVSDVAYASEAEASKVARAFSVEHPGILVDVRTAIAKDKRGYFRDGKRVPLFHANPRH